MRRFIRHRLAVIGSIILSIIVLRRPLRRRGLEQAVLHGRQGGQPATEPGSTCWAPTAPGRDVWARVVHGARTSLVVGLGAVAIYVTIGTILGGIAGLPAAGWTT